MSNLKQVGLAFQVWAGDNGDKYPMQVSVTNGGTMELVQSGNVFPHFLVMSNELSTPKILYCSNESDPARVQSTVFASTPGVGDSWQIPFVGDKNISYFVGVDANQTNAAMFLSGDRNITNDLPRRGSLLELTADQPVRWTREIHVKKGNILLTDCSAHWGSTPDLREALKHTGVATNRLAMP